MLSFVQSFLWCVYFSIAFEHKRIVTKIDFPPIYELKYNYYWLICRSTNKVCN